MLSCIVLAGNEEANIGEVVNNLSFCDEVLVVDDYSTDRTVEIAKSLGAIVMRRNVGGDFGAQRNFAMGESRGEWIFFVDVDEKVGRELRSEIRETVREKTKAEKRQSESKLRRDSSPILRQARDEKRKNEFSAFHIKRRDRWWGRELKYGETGNLKLIRLVRKNSGRFVGKVHETFETSGETSTLKSLLFHYPHPTVKDFLQEINFYSSLRASELAELGRRTNIFQIIFFPFGKFLYNYFLKLGFLDGAAGFVYAFMMSFHSFLVRAKLYTSRFNKDKSVVKTSYWSSNDSISDRFYRPE